VQGEIREAERSDQSGNGTRGLLDVLLAEHVKRLLQPRNVAGVAKCDGGVADDEAPADLVDEVEREHDEHLGTKRMPFGQPRPNARRAHARSLKPPLRAPPGCR
jgi:hypothetical protein